MEQGQARTQCAGAVSGAGRRQRDGGGWARLAAVARRGYLPAWLYLGNLVIAASFGWVAPWLRIACGVLAAAAITVIVLVLLAPRPMRAAGAQQIDGIDSDEIAGALGVHG